MIRLPKLTDYAIVLLATLARDDRAWSATELAEATSLPATTVAKILKTLARAGLLNSHRGKLGGYALARSAKSISLVDVIEAMDGPLCLTDCAGKGGAECIIEGECRVRGHWRRINDAVRKSFASLSIAEMAEPLPRGGRGGKLLRLARR